jgi:hypothetical protein
MDGDRLQVKLVKKRAVAAECPMPFLSFESMVCIEHSARLKLPFPQDYTCSISVLIV